MSITTKPLLAVPVGVGSDHLNGDLYLHPDFATFADDPTIQNLKSTHKQYREGFKNVVEAIGIVDPTVTESRRFLDLAKRSEAWLSSIANVGTASTTIARHELDRIERDIVDALGIRNGEFGGELRAHWKTLKPAERVSAAMAAIKANDTATLAAILVAPPALSGLTVEQHTTIRNEHERQNAGKLLARRKVVQKAIAINSRTFDDAMTELARLFPKATVAEITARTNEARAAKDAI